MKTLLILFILISTPYLHSQKNDSSLRSGQMYNYNTIISSSVNTISAHKSNIEGNRYVFNKTNTSGKIYTSKKTYTANRLNIDALNKDIVILIGKDSLLILEKNKIDSLTIENRKFCKLANNSFYEILYRKNDDFLLRDYNCYIKKGRANVMKGTIENDNYELTQKYYLYRGKVMSNSFIPTKKAFMEMFKGQRDEIKNFMKKNRIDLKKDEDIIKLVSHLLNNIN